MWILPVLLGVGVAAGITYALTHKKGSKPFEVPAELPKSTPTQGTATLPSLPSTAGQMVLWTGADLTNEAKASQAPVLILSDNNTSTKITDVLSTLLTSGLDVMVVLTSDTDPAVLKLIHGLQDDVGMTLLLADKTVCLAETSMQKLSTSMSKLAQNVVVPAGTAHVWFVILGSAPKGPYSLSGFNILASVPLSQM